MFDSVRMRLTTWYVGVLALVLLAFSLGVYLLLAVNLNNRFDAGLQVTLDTVSAMVLHELSEGEPLSEAAAGTIEELYFPLQSLTIYDDQSRLLAQKPAQKLSQSPALPEGVSAADSIAFYTLPADGHDKHGYRLAVRQARLTPADKPCIITVSQSRASIVSELEFMRTVFSVAVPIALLLAGIGGWLLAGKSLAPVVAMSARARQIGAENLDQRLAVVNPRDELGKLAAAFNELLARLSDSFARQRQFMADASHELRTPLHVIRAAAEVMLEQPRREEGEYREALTMIREQARRLTTIVEDMFMLARADAGSRALEETDFYLDELVIETAHAANLLAAHKGVSVEARPAPEILYRGDENLLRQMLLNLLDNAVKYTPAGGSVSISVTPRELEYEITVTDTGIGIPEYAQAHIFERFYRADSSRARVKAQGGAGLGLAIARWIAEAHHGRLELRSSDQRGSVFVVTLPVSLKN